jgi:uncharacterized membrane protein YoaK (UPF0700 family)
MTSLVLPAEPVGRVVFATATLSFVGGFVDVVGFIAPFGLFTAHVTGNFIMLGLEMVHATKLAIAKLLAVPIFIVMVALTRLFVLHYKKRTSPLGKQCCGASGVARVLHDCRWHDDAT